MSEQEEKNLPFSYHTFIFPFIWNHNGKVTRERFEKCIHPCWEPDVRQDAFNPQQYQQYCYFNQAARNAIFTEEGDKNPIVRNFRFNIGKLCENENWLYSEKDGTNPVKYVIEKDVLKYDPQTRKDVYDYTFVANLSVNGIRLRLFSTGVGMIVFELENYEYNTEKGITQINEYGRHVFMPFVNDGRCKLCADTITLQYPGGEIVSKFRGKEIRRNSDICFMELIMYFLHNNRYCATTSLRPDKNQLRIEPIIDDRMFVACAWNDSTLPNAMKQRVDGQYRYLYDALNVIPDDEDNVARRVYEFAFVDGTGLSCQSKDMLHDVLKDHVYSRWLEYGTLIAVSEYSIVTASNFEPNVTAFLMEYTEMMMLVLAQRATLLAFEGQISDCARGKLRVDRIQRAYVQFQSKYLLREVTPQQQGIDIYNLLLKNLFVSGMQDNLENQINALFALERDASDRDDNLILSALAILGVVEVIDCLVSNSSCLTLLLSALAAVCLVTLFLINHRNRLK